MFLGFDCGLDGRVARFGCHSVNHWACVEDFAAVFSVKIPIMDNNKNGGGSSSAVTGFSGEESPLLKSYAPKNN